MKAGIAAIFKNEEKYIVEWVAFHRVVGFTYFIVADNDSTDGSSELLRALEQLDLIKLVPYPTKAGISPQMPAYAKLLKLCSKDVDVLAFIDADEFVVPLDGATSVLPLFQKVFSEKDVSALALNWSNYGSSGQIFYRPDLVINRFVKHADQYFGVNNHYKSVVRPDRVQLFDNPHHAKVVWGRYVDCHGDEVKYHPRHGRGLSEKVLWSGARINHYVVKSVEEFLAGKSRNGSASNSARVKHERYFVSHDKNDHESVISGEIVRLVEDEVQKIRDAIAQLGHTQPTKIDSIWGKCMRKIFAK